MGVSRKLPEIPTVVVPVSQIERIIVPDTPAGRNVVRALIAMKASVECQKPQEAAESKDAD